MAMGDEVRLDGARRLQVLEFLWDYATTMTIHGIRAAFERVGSVEGGIQYGPAP